MATGGSVEARFDLPPCGSLLLWLSNAPRPSAPDGPAQVVHLDPVGPPQIRRLEDNVLVLDYLDLRAGGVVKPAVHCRQAARELFVRNGFAGNPWFESVQFADEHLRHKIPAASGFEATYRFTIVGAVPERLQCVLERPDLYRRITCNGTPIQPVPGAWWLDRSFGRIDLRGTARLGENLLVFEAERFTVFHELEPAYILGNFSLQPAERGFTIAPETPLRLETSPRGHATEPDGTMWLSGGIGFRPDLPPARPDDPAPYLIFDLGAATDLRAIRIWNYNEPHWSKLGVKKLAVTGGGRLGAGRLPVDLGVAELKPAPEMPLPPDGGDFPQTLAVDAKGIRFIRFDILSNHNGVEYPTRDKDHYFGLAGLSEVQFLAADRQPIVGAKVARASGELGIPGLCRRRAADLVNGSGLVFVGWNAQGHPFYSGGVAYREEFDVPHPNGRYCVALSDWSGSVAKINVNGKPAGHIAWRPWECEVTDLIHPGRNEIEVVVIGTLRNTLGPLHAGPPQGIATPQMFQQAPASGPPPGLRYSTVGYGLFRPFGIRNMVLRNPTGVETQSPH